MPNKTLTIGTNSQLIDINITGNLYADGSNLTNLNATNLLSGTVNWDRLPTSRIYDANASRTANTVLAAPNGSAGAASFRKLVEADLPTISASKISGTVSSATTATTASASNALNFVQTNELLLGNTNAQNRIWINYRRVVNGATSGNTAITEYHFGNGNAGTTGVTLYAANFSGVAAKATAANITTTANAIATYSNTTGTFSTKATASGAAYATAVNGALTFGTLPAAQGGTGNTSLQATRNAMGLGNTTGALPVANGGTGATSLTSGYAIIGNGTSAVTTRAITNITATTTALTANTNLITANTLRYLVNRTTSVAAADTSYTTYMARGAALVSSATNPSYNGQITWQYS